MNENDELITDLNDIYPISNAFQNDLDQMMKTIPLAVRKVLFRPDKVARKAYRLTSGVFAGTKVNESGLETVERIIMPGSIFTDLASFYEGEKISLKIWAVTPAVVQELTKKDYKKLEKYPETAHLARHFILLQNKIEEGRASMLKLDKEERLKFLAEHYKPFTLIPNGYAANFLNMAEDEYLEYKAIYLSKQNAVLQHKRSQPYRNLKELAYKVKIYIANNYTSPELAHDYEIASIFNTSKKSLERAFKLTFNTSPRAMILKYRMEKARELLDQREKSITEISMAVGFKTATYFSRVFKRYHGRSPMNL